MKATGLALAAAATLLFFSSTTSTAGESGTLSGTVWNDLNTNGARDVGEPGIEGWTVEVYDSRSPCVSQPPSQVCYLQPSEDVTTDVDGACAFSGITGQPTICLVMNDGWSVTGTSGTARGYGCYETVPRNSASIYVTLSDGAPAQADFAVVQEAVRLERTTRCPQSASVGTQFECSFTIRNTGAVQVAGLTAGLGFGACGFPEGCIVGVGGDARGVNPLSAVPTWTALQGQYSYPLWDPLGQGVLRSGRSITVTVRLRAVATSHPQQLLCAGATGYARFNDYTVPFLTVASDAEVCTPLTVTASILGDTNCDGRRDSVDAVLVLQFGGRLLATLACLEAAGANGDGVVDAIDASLILQFSAGLLAELG